MFFDEIHQAVHGFRFGDVELDRCFADVEVDLAGCAADVAEIRVRHLTGAIYDAAHDGNLDSLEMLGARLDAAGHGLEVEQRPTAGRAGDIIGLKGTATRRLQDVVGQAQRLARARLTAD